MSIYDSDIFEILIQQISCNASTGFPPKNINPVIAWKENHINLCRTILGTKLCRFPTKKLKKMFRCLHLHENTKF